MQKCGESKCGTYSSCITCLFVVEEDLLVQRTTAECRHVCSNVTLYIQADPGSGPTLQAPSTCLSLIRGETCKASVRYRVFQDGNLVTEVYAAASAGSEWAWSDNTLAYSLVVVFPNKNAVQNEIIFCWLSFLVCFDLSLTFLLIFLSPPV